MFFSIFLFIITIISGTTEDINYMLPKTIRPIHYNLTFIPYILTNSLKPPFYGSMDLSFTPITKTKNITLHAKNIIIIKENVSVANMFGTNESITNIEYYPQVEFIVIHLEKELTMGSLYYLKIPTFKGVLKLRNHGFYLAKYQENGIERRMALTYLEPRHARNLFPNLDEPQWKATFAIQIVRPVNYISLSNEALQNSIDLGNGLVKDIYKTTAVMSSYLVAILVAPFKYIEMENQRVYARSEAIENGWAQHALDSGVNILKFLGNLFDIPYTLTKIYQVAIPEGYFVPSAMENWGLVMYREASLLYDHQYSTTYQYIATTTVIIHEFVHQWFGNLVTCATWKYTWMNEGFATFFQTYVISKGFPNWKMYEKFVFNMHKALAFDSLTTTTAINFMDNKGRNGPPDIIYKKAGSILRMIQHFLTDEIFMEGVRIYLKERKFGSVTPKDLFQAWQSLLDEKQIHQFLHGRSVEFILSAWFEQPGYPLVTITRNYDDNTISLSQVRFVMHQNATDYLWPIPINFVYSNNFDYSTTTAELWFDKKQMTFIPLEKYSNSAFVLANKLQTGFYRVNYDATNWNRIINFLINDDFTRIHCINRAGLIDDAFQLAKAGVISYKIPLDLTKYILRETEYIPLQTFTDHMKFIEALLTDTDELTIFKTYVLRLLKKVSKHLTFYSNLTDTYHDRLNRANIMEIICHFGDRYCRNESLNTLRKWKLGSLEISPDIQLYAFCAALAIGNKDDWNYAFNRYLKAKEQPLRSRLMKALGCTENEKILYSYLNKILEIKSKIPAIDNLQAYLSVPNLGNMALNVSFTHFTRNYKIIRRYNPRNVRIILSLFKNKFVTTEQLNELKRFAEGKENQEDFISAIQTVTDNVSTRQRFLPVIKEWIHDHVSEVFI